MAIAPATTETTYALAGGNLGPFATIFPYAAPADVQASLDLGDVRTVLAQPSQFTVASATPLAGGGAVTLSAALLTAGAWPAGASLTLARATADGQPSTYGEVTGFSPKSSEDALDYVARQVQELKTRLGRALLRIAGAFDAQGFRIRNAADPVLGQDVATLASLRAAAAGFTVGQLAEFPVFPTRTAAQLATLGADVKGAIFLGYGAPGDGGQCLNLVVAVEPAHEGKTETADGKWLEIADPILSWAMFGAVQDGVADDTIAVNHALTVGRPVAGDKAKTVGVTGDVPLPATVRIRATNFKQLAPAAVNRRTLYQLNGTYCELADVKVDRNGNGSEGGLNTAGGVFLDTCAKARLIDVEVTGNSMGGGIVLNGCSDFDLVRPNVHDMVGNAAAGAQPGDEVVEGISINLGGRGAIDSPRVRNILTQWLGQAPTNQHSRGISVGGAADLQIVNPLVGFVDEAIDLTGSENPDRIVVIGGTLYDCGTWGGKCANTATHIRWIGTLALRCGLAGFVASNWLGSAVQTERIVYDSCVALGTGSNGRWAANGPTGFLVESQGAPYANYPRGITWNNCEADGVGGDMHFGFRNDGVVADALAGDYWLEAINCRVLNHTVNEFQGINQGYYEVQRDAAFAVPNNAYTPVPWDLTVFDRMNATVAGSGDQILARRNGVLLVSGCIQFTANATGIRQARLTRNGGQVGRRVVQAIPTAGSVCDLHFNFPVLVDAGDVLRVEIFQDSGGALNLPAGGSDLVASYISFGAGQS